MNILITGSNGFIGSHLTKSLLEDYKLHYIFSKKQKSTINKGFIIDLADKELTTRKISKLFTDIKINGIIHLASKMASSSDIENTKILEDNMVIAMNISKIAKIIMPDFFINFSSMSIYPNVSGTFSEKSLPNPYKNSDFIYGLSKYNSEEIINYFLNKANIKISHLRIAQVYGKGMNSNRTIPMMLKELKENNEITIYGNGDRSSNFIQIDKLISVVNFIVKKKISGIYNIGEENISYYELANKLINQCGNKNSVIKILNKGSNEKFVLDTNKFDSLS